MSQVDITKTPVDMRSYGQALARAWQAIIGGYPTKEQAGVLWAQYGIETGAGPWCWNNNIGNVKHVDGDGFDFIMLPNTWEMIGGKRVVFQPPSRATWFRAYSTLDAGMLEQFRLLHGTRYAPAWEGVELGDCGVFARKLKAAGYFTADANAYAKGMLAHFALWVRATAFDDAMADIQAAGDTPTQPAIEAANDVGVDGGIVHPDVDLGDPDPPPEAA